MLPVGGAHAAEFDQTAAQLRARAGWRAAARHRASPAAAPRSDRDRSSRDCRPRTPAHRPCGPAKSSVQKGRRVGRRAAAVIGAQQRQVQVPARKLEVVRIPAEGRPGRVPARTPSAGRCSAGSGRCSTGRRRKSATVSQRICASGSVMRDCSSQACSRRVRAFLRAALAARASRLRVAASIVAVTSSVSSSTSATCELQGSSRSREVARNPSLIRSLAPRGVFGQAIAHAVLVGQQQAVGRDESCAAVGEARCWHRGPASSHSGVRSTPYCSAHGGGRQQLQRPHALIGTGAAAQRGAGDQQPGQPASAQHLERSREQQQQRALGGFQQRVAGLRQTTRQRGKHPRPPGAASGSAAPCPLRRTPAPGRAAAAGSAAPGRSRRWSGPGARYGSSASRHGHEAQRSPRRRDGGRGSRAGML